MLLCLLADYLRVIKKYLAVANLLMGGHSLIGIILRMCVIITAVVAVNSVKTIG